MAGMLHRLGVNMGPPFWATNDDDSEDNYEPCDLSWHLRRWWEEPQIVEQVPAVDRIRFLERWCALQECVGPGPIGAKHPLLSLCGPDLVAAWGPELRFIWSWRPLDESVAGLQRRKWITFRGHEVPLQEKLWNALNDFERSHTGIVKVDWRRVKSDPLWGARELASLAGVEPSDAQLQAAADFVRPETQSKRPWWRKLG
jgi:hypothetical protein